MATINYDFYDNKDIYNDGDVENRLFEYYKYGKELDLTNDENYYLTCKTRENIISWYPFKNNSSILEIGAGVGTVTGKLCELCSHVVSIEGSKRRAEILYERHKSNNNLDVYVGNFSDIIIKEKFDYIILVGVFEYSKIFFNKENPFDYFLSNLKKYLKRTGKLLIAIENRYGIKYWAGNDEDHLGKPFIGLEGYDNQKVRTFGRDEIKKIFEKNGFKKIKFYSVFPDYKMPQLIFSDNYKFGRYELESIPVYNFKPENYNFDPRKMLYGLQENKMLSFFANSYIIEAGTNISKKSNIKYVKYQPFREENYDIITMINDKNEIFKKANNKEAKAHLENMVNIFEKLKNNRISINNIELKKEILKVQKINGETFDNVLIKYINNHDKFIEIFDKYANYINSCCEKRKVTKLLVKDTKKLFINKSANVLKVGLLDFNLGNVIYNENNFTLIDQEWQTDCDIPELYVIYFSIKLFFEKLKLESNLKEELLKKYKINNNMIELFNNMSRTYFMEIKKVNNMVSMKKNIEHNYVIINQEKKELKKDLEFYKDLVERQKEGYENEIQRISNEARNINNDLNKKLK